MATFCGGEADKATNDGSSLFLLLGVEEEEDKYRRVFVVVDVDVERRISMPRRWLDLLDNGRTGTRNDAAPSPLLRPQQACIIQGDEDPCSRTTIIKHSRTKGLFM